MSKKLLLLGLVALLAPATVLAGPISKIVVIGDSLSDQGNGFLLTGGTFPPPPYAGRASNGPVAVERLAQRLGVALDPAALPGGTNYAVLGAMTGTENFAAPVYGQPALAGTGMFNQTLAYLGTGPVANPDGTLFVVWGGPNDFFLSATPAAAAEALDNLLTSIGILYLNGARRFLVPNMPDLSLTPSGRALPPPVGAGLQALVAGFNAALESGLESLELFLPGIDITPFDTFGLLTSIAATPAAFGFSNAQDACLTGDLGTGGVACADPAAYVFWDSVHPTAAAHQVLGDAFARAVPEPATLSFMLIGVAAGAVARRRRSRRLAA